MRLVYFTLCFCYAALVWAQAPIEYHLELNNIHHHELGVRIEFPALPPQPLVVRMPQASPGRYAVHNFAKNVYSVTAKNAAGEELPVQRTGLSEWTITGHHGQATIHYTLFANRADGTYAKVDNRKLHLNMPATFLYGVGLNDRPVDLYIPTDQHSDWKVATQLQHLGNRHFRAPDYYYFYDSPTMVGDIRFRAWTVAGDERVDTIEMAFLTPDPDSLLDNYAAWTEQIVAEQQRVYGELPAFDYGRYTFLCAYNAYVNGDGMEHRNSTICTAPVALEDYAERLIGTVSHEFFHCWNVERIRPASLEPFNFDEANLCGELWFAEGFTSYYDDLTLARTGIIAPEEYAKGIARMLNYVLLHPGTQYRSPIGMSQCAPFVDAATAIDSDNFDNTFISYYSYGAVLGLVLDLTLRRDFDTDLDTYMRTVWQRYGRTEVPYHIPDLIRVLAEVSGDAIFAQTWFTKHIYASQLPNVHYLLRDFGIKTRVKQPDSVGFYGLELKEHKGELRVEGTVYTNNPLYEAGVESTDVLLALNDSLLTTEADWKARCDELQIGQTYSIRYRQNGVEKTGTFTAAVDPSFEVLLIEKPSKKVLTRRNSWLQE